MGAGGVAGGGGIAATLASGGGGGVSNDLGAPGAGVLAGAGVTAVVVAAAGGKFTVILFDLNPEERTDYRRFLESQHIAYIDCDRPERNDPSLRLSDLQHPTPKLNELLAKWIEPVLAAPAQVVSVRTDAALGAGGNR